MLTRYANTHTEASATGRQTGALREEARQIIHRGIGAGPEDVVLFCGSGATAAVNKLVAVLGLRVPEALDDRYALTRLIPQHERPVVLVGPYEHHSNELPWRETVADVVTVGAGADGHVDLADLRRLLYAYRERPLLIGSFSAASNVTGLLTEADPVSRLLHEHGALSVWDYAAAGPYLPIRMRESAPGRNDHKDAVFLSPHKFVGGPQTPGVLALNRALLTNRVPTMPGGGTVAFVDPVTHRYLDDPVAREEGGTPAVVESIRAGLAFSVKEAVGTDTIAARERWRCSTTCSGSRPGVAARVPAPIRPRRPSLAATPGDRQADQHRPAPDVRRLPRRPRHLPAPAARGPCCFPSAWRPRTSRSVKSRRWTSTGHRGSTAGVRFAPAWADSARGRRSSPPRRRGCRLG